MCVFLYKFSWHENNLCIIYTDIRDKNDKYTDSWSQYKR